MSCDRNKTGEYRRIRPASWSSRFETTTSRRPAWNEKTSRNLACESLLRTRLFGLITLDQKRFDKEQISGARLPCGTVRSRAFSNWRRKPLKASPTFLGRRIRLGNGVWQSDSASPSIAAASCERHRANDSRAQSVLHQQQKHALKLDLRYSLPLQNTVLRSSVVLTCRVRPLDWAACPVNLASPAGLRGWSNQPSCAVPVEPDAGRVACPCSTEAR